MTASARSARSLAALAVFRTRLDELGATLLEHDWLGVHTPHRVRCAAGHYCQPRPSGVQQGHGPCRVCVGKDPATAEAGFRARLDELGVQLLEPEWLGAIRLHRVRCAEGHDGHVRPSWVKQGGAVCRPCTGRDPAIAEAAFRARLDELGAVPLYEKWLGSHWPHYVRCAAGHDCHPRPDGVLGGQGICRPCKGMLWDAFYVVTHASEPRVKFGITSGDPRPRLRHHRRSGYVNVVYLAISLPGTVAPDTERAIKSALALAGERPVRGREYFDISCLPLIIDVADGWIAVQDTAITNPTADHTEQEAA